MDKVWPMGHSLLYLGIIKNNKSYEQISITFR
jgi:hypothetical protein